jgi:hypothetical protein
MQVDPNVIVSVPPWFFTPHATLESKELNYNTLHIENVPNIPSMFDEDVLFEFPLVDNPNNHFG